MFLEINVEGLLGKERFFFWGKIWFINFKYKVVIEFRHLLLEFTTPLIPGNCLIINLNPTKLNSINFYNLNILGFRDDFEVSEFFDNFYDTSSYSES